MTSLMSDAHRPSYNLYYISVTLHIKLVCTLMQLSYSETGILLMTVHCLLFTFMFFGLAEEPITTLLGVNFTENVYLTLLDSH